MNFKLVTKGVTDLSELNLQLYVVTDRAWLNGKRLEDQVEAAILGGATIVQLREKSLSGRDFYQTALNIKEITDRYRIPLIINDRLDIALAVDAAGLHVGQGDLPPVIARRLLGPEKILGVSVTNLEEAIQAEEDGADYLGVGAVFPTGTKQDAATVDFPELKKITGAVQIPVVAIGGINENNALQLKDGGIKGIAVVSAVFGKEDPKKAAAKMRQIVELII
jgi:thiamine-phosphate pyrophosphorylase